MDIAHSFFLCVTLAPTTGARLTPGGVPCSAESCEKNIKQKTKLILAFLTTETKLLVGTLECLMILGNLPLRHYTRLNGEDVELAPVSPTSSGK